MARHAAAYLATRPREELWEFLRHDFKTLTRRHGGVIGTKVPIPRLIRIPEQKSA